MEFIINCAELIRMAEEMKEVSVVKAAPQINMGCPNCRDNCATWCTALNANKLYE